MNENAEKLQKKLEDLEAGKPLEEALDGLDENEVELLELASTLREFEAPARNLAIVEEQIRKIKQTAVKDNSQDKGTAMKSIFQRTTWFTPAMATAMLVLFGCLVVAGLGLGGLTLVRLSQGGNDPARVQEIQGILEFQAKDGSWQVVKDNARLAPGTRVRTGELSSAQLSLQDGSLLHLGASTEITLDQMDRFLLGKRIVRLTQWYGETSHDVQSNNRTGSLYEVRTPTATIAAKGTAFDVDVLANLLTRVSVNEGIVDLTGAEDTISLEPGQTSAVAVDQSPVEPTSFVSGEGIVTISENNWTIAGENIAVDETTELNGNPQNGDLVSFEGRQLSDGTVLVDRLDRLAPPQAGTFTLSGQLENIASTGLVLNGKYIALNPDAGIEATLQSGDAVITQGVIEPNGTWLASHVFSASTGQPFQFVGTFQSSQGNRWMISGSEITVDENTAIGPNILAGDVVNVTGWIQENGTWLAGSIQPVLASVARFDFTGTVDSIDPWVISGKTVVVRPWTLIDSNIQSGDLVHVQGPVLEDGTWVAAAITKVSENPNPENVTLEFTGTVNSVNPWVISGIQLVVDASTQINGEIPIGALVKVRATLQPDGLWHADEITLIVPNNLGCVTFASVVTTINGDLISLQNGMTINVNEVGQVDGTLETESVVLITKCLAPDGSVTIPLIQVLSNPPQEPTPTPTATQTITSTPAPVSIILPNCYKITFLGFTENADGTSTWRYLVEELSCAQDLSNWVLELPACSTVVGASPTPWEVVQPDPNHHLNGIKWETGAGFESGEFSVTLAGELTTGTVHVGAKGPDVAIGSIAGPTCETPTTATPTVVTTVTITETVTLDVTATALPPTAVPPTAVPPTIQPPPASSGTIIISDNDQTLTFTCNGNAVEVRGNANVITLLGSCASITVRGNGNVIYYSGSPVITNTGNENIIQQR
jgi:hypothetical protein